MPHGSRRGRGCILILTDIFIEKIKLEPTKRVRNTKPKQVGENDRDDTRLILHINEKI